MPNRPPAFQFYVKDWLASKTIARLTPAQRGGYIQLLAHCWNDDDCSLIDDERILSSLSGLKSLWRNGTAEAIRDCFCPHPEKEGYLTHKKLWEQWIKSVEWREHCAKGGRKSGEARRKGSMKGSSTDLEPPLNTAPASASASALASESSEEQNSLAASGQKPEPAGRRRKPKDPDPAYPTGYQKAILSLFADAFRRVYGEDWQMLAKDATGARTLCRLAKADFTVIERKLGVAVELARLKGKYAPFPKDAVAFAGKWNHYTEAALRLARNEAAKDRKPDADREWRVVEEKVFGI